MRILIHRKLLLNLQLPISEKISSVSSAAAGCSVCEQKCGQSLCSFPYHTSPGLLIWCAGRWWGGCAAWYIWMIEETVCTARVHHTRHLLPSPVGGLPQLIDQLEPDTCRIHLALWSKASKKIHHLSTDQGFRKTLLMLVILHSFQQNNFFITNSLKTV